MTLPWARAHGARKLRDLTTAEIEAWASTGPLLAHAGRKPKPSTVGARMKVARAVLNVARDKGWIVPDLKLRAAGGQSDTAKYLSAEDRDRLIAAADEHSRPYVATLFLTGGRTVEVARVRWGDIRAPSRSQSMSRIILRHRKSSSHRSRELEWKTRAVPLAPRLLELLPKTTGRPEEYVFGTRMATHWWTGPRI